MLSEDSRKLLYNAAIASRLNYCDMVWHNCGAEYTNKLQTIQNKSARRILNKLPRTSAAPLLKELGRISLSDKRQLHKCVFLHRLLQGKGPTVLKDMLAPYKEAETRTTRGSTSNCLYIPGFKTDYIRKSYMYEAVKLWNSIPAELRNIKNSDSFKEKLHIYFFSRS